MYRVFICTNEIHMNSGSQPKGIVRGGPLISITGPISSFIFLASFHPIFLPICLFFSFIIFLFVPSLFPSVVHRGAQLLRVTLVSFHRRGPLYTCELSNTAAATRGLNSRDPSLFFGIFLSFSFSPHILLIPIFLVFFVSFSQPPSPPL